MFFVKRNDRQTVVKETMALHKNEKLFIFTQNLQD